MEQKQKFNIDEELKNQLIQAMCFITPQWVKSIEIISGKQDQCSFENTQSNEKFNYTHDLEDCVCLVFKSFDTHSAKYFSGILQEILKESMVTLEFNIDSKTGSLLFQLHHIPGIENEVIEISDSVLKQNNICIQDFFEKAMSLHDEKYGKSTF